MSPREVVDEIFATYQKHGHKQYGEDVTELQHALQAGTFARQFGETEAVVAAALLHDYGHLIHDLGEDVADRGVDALHENLGAAALSQWFGPEIVEPARLHVAAKRYLCWQNPHYHDGLSAASQQSLRLQGGPMTDDEAQAFERLPHYAAAVSVRRYDDMGKVPDMETPTLEGFRATVESFVRA